jgi:hypothetical protein
MGTEAVISIEAMEKIGLDALDEILSSEKPDVTAWRHVRSWRIAGRKDIADIYAEIARSLSNR